ncbi:Na/Pi cotransporter family protein [Reichenbachiella versicolor]|uniref:Na/Pi cotransporter family protein n=1 Tax=Reichenbachiella versicolor TaxID=1821036 RepID=UPI000D6DC9D5|nr:Na/Pi cotransporter family protein [Reichenbachiella versicolor]
MEYGIFEILELIGALGFFIYGMKVMSESIQKVAGDKLRSVMSMITSNRVSAVFTGFLTTSIIQSSSATTVMVVSFVNAGLLKLKEAIGVIMGANIGTTITAILIIVFGFSKFSISHYTLPIIAFGFPLLFSKKVSLKYWGEFLIGFALLFMGLDSLKHAVPDLKNNPEVLEWIADINSLGFVSIIISVLLGTLLTVVVQSSSAAMAITLIMCDNGWIPFEMAAAIVLGENIGTTITANLAALVGNYHAKRAAFAHFIFNVFGVVWMLIIFQFFLGAIDSVMVSTDNGSPLNDTLAVKWGLTYFHISFNIINTLVMIWFVPQIAKVVTKVIKSSDDDADEYQLEFIGTNLMRTAELSLLEAKKVIVRFGKILIEMNDSMKELIQVSSKKKQDKLFDKIIQYEEQTDSLELSINNYLVKVSEGRLTANASNEVSSMMSITNDLENIADVYLGMANDIKRRNKNNLEYSEKQNESTLVMFDKLSKALDLMQLNLEGEYGKIDIQESKSTEDDINAYTKKLNKSHLKNINKDNYDVATGIVYRDVVYACEKVGDHIIRVADSMAGESYEEDEV